MGANGVFVFLPFFFSALVIFFIVLFIVIARFRVVEQPGSSSSPTPVDWRGPEGSAASGRWNGEILGNGAISAMGGTLGSTFGVFEVKQGLMTFTPDGAAEPNWTTPCSSLVVAQRGFMSFNGADVSITWPTGAGVWHQASCNVSRERINRLMDNDFKDLRERGYATEFIACLAANGARVNQ